MGDSKPEDAFSEADHAFMARALVLAHEAAAAGEVPVGCVLVDSDGVVVGEGANRREMDNDPLAHAEVLAMTAAAKRLGRWRLSGLTAYVTLEPCFMCAGGLVNARVDRLVIGAMDPKAGAVGSLFDVCRFDKLNHRLDVQHGLQSEACGDVLRAFFRARRRPKGFALGAPFDEESSS